MAGMREFSDETHSVARAVARDERLYSMISRIFFGFLLLVMIVAVPAPVAISAAMSLVSMPPVPSLDPKEAVLTATKPDELEAAEYLIKRHAFRANGTD